MVQSWTRQLKHSFCSVLATRCGANELKSKWFMSQRRLLDLLLVLDTEWPFQIHLAKPPKPVDLEFTKCTISNETMCTPSNSIYPQNKMNNGSFEMFKYTFKKFWFTKEFRLRSEQQFYCPVNLLPFIQVFYSCSSSVWIFLFRSERRGQGEEDKRRRGGEKRRGKGGVERREEESF